MGLFYQCEKIKKRVENKIFLSTMHVGVDEEKSTKTRKKMRKKKGIFQMMNKNNKSNIDNFIDKIFKSMNTYDINENTKILILSDGEKQIKKIYKAIKAIYKNNTVSYSLDKFHLTSIFKKIYPYQNKNKENRETYHKVIDYFYNGKYEELLQCLEDSKFFISDAKLFFLNKAITLIKNNKEGIKNQTLEYNRLLAIPGYLCLKIN